MTRQARRVDEQLAAFCEAEHAQLTGLLTLVTGDRHVAEEFAQETLERACANWPRVRVMDNRRAWLRRVALNLAASRYRRRRAEWRANRRHGEPTTRIEETAVSLADREAVASPPPQQRTVIAALLRQPRRRPDRHRHEHRCAARRARHRKVRSPALERALPRS
jgi:DNA-directed RNA polymerase specialized sigma24 family protein